MLLETRFVPEVEAPSRIPAAELDPDAMIFPIVLLETVALVTSLVTVVPLAMEVP